MKDYLNMKRNIAWVFGLALVGLVVTGCRTTPVSNTAASVLVPLPAAQSAPSAAQGILKIDGIYYETARERIFVRGVVLSNPTNSTSEVRTSDGRRVRISVSRTNDSYDIALSAKPFKGIKSWGFAVEAAKDEYFTGLMERVIDGPQQASWAPGITTAMNLRGEKVDMILKPTTSVYAPFYLSSRGYGLLVKTYWPGKYDFCVSDPNAVQISFEGPSVAFKVYASGQPAEVVKAHALDAGPPFLPPKWSFTPWRWRDEHRIRTNYYDGTPVAGPFNALVMEDVLMMRAFGIPCGVYWIDRPWGPGKNGYDDFEIDPKRLPHFGKMVEWLNAQDTKTVLWIGPFFQGHMETNALKNGWNLAGQKPQRNNYPLADFSNPAAKKYWQDGVAKLLKLGVAGFKLDRAEEGIPDDGPYTIHDGRSLREQRNNYPVMYVKAAYEVAKQHRGDDFLCMPRAAYHGSSPYGVFWGGDIGGNNEGLRGSIIGQQRAAVMGYPNWGSDTCGYSRPTLEQELCIRWLAFSCFSPIMEVGPTKDVGFWNLPREPKYDTNVIAAWRMYARLHQRLVDYGYEHAKEATKTGMPIVRPLFFVDPQAPAAWDNWWTYLYGRDLLVSPVWAKGQQTQQVYLPAGEKWQDAWNLETIHDGGQTITVDAPAHKIPIYIRVGSNLELGDLNKEWTESLAIASNPPNLAPMDVEVRAWFEKQK
jgi:alpha-D-xyloside xylohydrolase